MENEAEEQQPRPQERNNRRQAPSYNDIRQNIRTIKTVVRIVRMATNPAVIWALVGIFIAIAIYMLFFSSAGALPFGGGSSSSQQTPTTGAGNPKTPPIPGLTLTLAGRPDAVANGTNIEYTVTVTYDKTTATIPIENITVYLDVPVNSDFIKGSGSPTQNGKTVEWPLSDTQNQSSFTFVLNPTANDITLPVKVYAKTTGGGGSAGGSSPEAFRNLIAGQGRNTAILGDKTSFVSTILANSSGLPLAGKENYLSQIYDAGIQYHVNPLILTVIWGVENSFDPTPNLPFGCFESTGLIGFSENVTCAGGTIDMHMKTFEANSSTSLEIPSTTGNTCVYTDAFDYSYEWYTPVCHSNDGNDPARANFISFYTKLKGI